MMVTKRLLMATALVALLLGPASAQTNLGMEDYDTYMAVEGRAAAIFKDLLSSESRSWHVEVVLRKCGYPVPEGLRLPNEQLLELIMDRATTAHEIDLAMQVLATLRAWIAGYKVGVDAGFPRETLSETTCREARETTQDILALR